MKGYDLHIEFSIIIPVKTINNYIRETIFHVQNFPSKNWEVIIITDSQDKTEWASSKIKIISSGQVGPAIKRNLGAKSAKGDILVFLDDDSYPSLNLLEIAKKKFINKDIIALAGPGITPKNNTFWQKVSGAVFYSKFGGGNPERYISLGKPRYVDDWPTVNLMVRKNIFSTIGGFRLDFWPGEDTLFCADLINFTHKKILYLPELIVFHHRRSGLLRHLKQVGNYGLHRGFFVKKFPSNSLKLKYFFPSFFVFFCLLFVTNLFLSFKLNIIFGLILLIYLIAIFKALLDILKYEQITIALVSIIYIILTHFWYGIKFIEGFLRIGNLKSKLRNNKY